MVVEVTEQDFNTEVLEADVPVFACFTAPPCGSCFALCLVTESLAREYQGSMKFVKIDIGKESELAARYHIVPLPTVLIFRDAEPVHRLLGFHSPGPLKVLIDGFLAEGTHST
ncbi:MAG: thioredoxin domain-containing protein [Chloroflexota bacterium]|nr:thioredoxin domain-containing protein [Chloroflexota bacterium]